MKLAYIVLPVFAIVTIINYTADPANIFSAKKYVGGIADILSQGHNVDNIANYDERLLQEEMVKRLIKTPDIVIIGSSRIMEIGTDFFPGKSVLNCGVSHANIHDLIGITGVLDSFALIPGHMIINLDPDIIANGGTLEWQSLSAYHDFFLDRQPDKKDLYNKKFRSNKLNKISSLFSFDYFKQSLTFIAKGATKKYYDVVYKRPAVYGRFSDGTICYSYQYMNPDSSQVALNARVAGTKDGISGPDPYKIKLLNLLLDFLQTKNVKIEFLMLPFHPEYYMAVNANQKNLFQIYESFFLGLAKQRHIPIYGGFDAKAFDIRQSQFYDMYHCSKQAIKQIYVNR